MLRGEVTLFLFPSHHILCLSLNKYALTPCSKVANWNVACVNVVSHSQQQHALCLLATYFSLSLWERTIFCHFVNRIRSRKPHNVCSHSLMGSLGVCNCLNVILLCAICHNRCSGNVLRGLTLTPFSVMITDIKARIVLQVCEQKELATEHLPLLSPPPHPPALCMNSLWLTVQWNWKNGRGVLLHWYYDLLSR